MNKIKLNKAYRAANWKMLGLTWFLSSLLFTTAWAQESKAVFDKTIDQFNRTTIRYVLAADQEKKESAELAKKVVEPTYDLAQLPADIQKIYGKNSKTEILSNNISKQKNNFIAGKPLTQQFAAAIQLIRDDRKGKPYLAALEKELIAMKEAALKEPVTTIPTPQPQTATAPNDQTPSLETQIADLRKQLNNLSNQPVMPVPPPGVPPYVYVLLALVGALSVYNYWLLRQWKNRKRHHSSETKLPETSVSSSLMTEEINRKIKENVGALERKMDAQREQFKRELEEIKREIRKTADKMPQPGRDKTPPATVTNTHREATSTPSAKPNVSPINTKPPVATPGVATPGTTVELDVKRTSPVQEPAKPRTITKYADYPKENGFVIAQLSDSSDRRSIYEINISPDQTQATFTIVNDPAIHEYAIQNRERLLKDACDFEISSSKHARIEVIQPGTLKLDGNAWQIHSKAKIRFV
ncbi:MAG: hypothetical protein V4714_15135 [Bacteroidota bacterium]